MTELLCIENYMVDALRHLKLARRCRASTNRCIVNVKKKIAIP